MSRQISKSRKAVFYAGLAVMVIGFLLFGSVFVTAIANFGDFRDFDNRSRSMMTRAFGGMVLVMLGAVVSNLGARGAAGSGFVLDPKRAREDLEPYARLAGGLLKDALDEADLRLGEEKEEKRTA